MFQIDAQPRAGVITVIRTGLWDVSEARRYAAAMARMLSDVDASGARPGLLIDISRAETIPKEVALEMEPVVEAICRSPVRKVAMIGTSVIALMQARRIFSGRVPFKGFDNVDDGRAWLMQSE